MCPVLGVRVRRKSQFVRIRNVEAVDGTLSGNGVQPKPQGVREVTIKGSDKVRQHAT